MYDAVGSAVTKTRRYLERSRRGMHSDVIVVILTDGMENASRRWAWRQVVDLITEAEESGWQFVFLGANQDSWAVSQHLGIKKGAVVDWAADRASAARAFKEAAYATSDYRISKKQQRRYRDRRDR